MGIDAPKSWDYMSFEELERDPVASPVLQEEAFKYLQTEDKEYFNREFTGERDNHGWLIGKASGMQETMPSQNIGAAGMEKVARATIAALKAKGL